MALTAVPVHPDLDDEKIRQAIADMINDSEPEQQQQREYIASCDFDTTDLDFRQHLGYDSAYIVHASCELEALLVISDNVVRATARYKDPIKYRDFFGPNPRPETLPAIFHTLSYELIEVGSAREKHLYPRCTGRTTKPARAGSY